MVEWIDLVCIAKCTKFILKGNLNNLANKKYKIKLQGRM